MNVFELYAKLGLDSSEFESGLKAAQNAGSALGHGLATAAKAGLTAITAATTAVIGMGTASVKTGAEFDKSMSQVAATMGTTVDQISNLREFAQEMGRTTAFSATQAADALNYMALAGYDATTSMEMLPNVLNLAAAGSIDLARASDMITDTQTAFGISLARTTQMVDEMAKAASTGNTSVEQLGDAFLTVGGLAQELNGGFVYLKDGTEVAVDGVQELEIALTAMANAGIKGSEAGTHMRNMLLKLSSPTSDGTKALEAMGVAVFDTEGNMRSLADIFVDLGNAMGTMTQEQKIQTIADLFNSRDIASAEALLKAVEQDWDSIGASIIDAEGAAEAMAKTQLDNLAGDVTLFQSALEGAKIAISDKLTPSLREFVQLGTKGLSSLTVAFGKFDASPYLDSMGRLTEEGARAQAEFEKNRQAAIDELFGTVSDGVGLIMEKVPMLVNAGMKLIEAVGKGLLDNLPVIIEAGTEIISELSTALVDNMPKIIQAGSDILNGLLTAISDNMDSIAPMITDFIVGFVQIMADNADKMIEIAIAIAGAIGDGLVQSAPIISEKAPEIIGALTEAIAKNPAALIALGPKIIGFITKGIKIGMPLVKSASKLLSSNFGTSMITSLQGVLSNVGTTLTSGLSSIWSFATADIGTTLAAGGISAVTTALTAITSSILAFFAGSEIGKKIGGFLFPNDEELYDSYSGIAGTFKMLKDTIIGVIDLIKFAWEDYTEQVKLKMSLAWEGIKVIYSEVSGWFEAKFNEAKTLVTAVWDSITLPFKLAWEAIQLIYEVVADFFEGNFQDAYDKVTGVWDAISDFFEGVWTDIKNAFHLDEVWQWGKDLVANFSKGIKDNIGTVISAVTGVSGTVSDYLHFSEPEKGPLADFHTFAPDMIDLFTSGLEAGKPQLESTLNDVLTMPEAEAQSLDFATTNASSNGGDTSNLANIITEALKGILVEVNIGDEKLDNIISTSIQRTNYRSGGR